MKNIQDNLTLPVFMIGGFMFICAFGAVISIIEAIMGTL
tara:strand:+ start:166 stop:282 length:117 start_codon:yes stop_codon:yes gene_type:complete